MSEYRYEDWAILHDALERSRKEANEVQDQLEMARGPRRLPPGTMTADEIWEKIRAAS